MSSSIKTIEQRLRNALHSPMADTMNRPESEKPKTTESDDDDLPTIDKKKERQLVRKLDRYIVPMMMLLYLMSFLDRYGWP